MIRTKLALIVLSKKDQIHLTKMNIHSMSGFLRTRAEQIPREMLWRVDSDHHSFPCFDCANIARKLGVS